MKIIAKKDYAKRMKQGRIVKNISNLYTVACNHELYNCLPRGKFRNVGLTPLVGDEVLFDPDKLSIIDILPRQNELDRPRISNIDIALIITSLKKPDLSLNLLDKELTCIILAHIKPVICFTKLDLISQEELANLKKLRKYYESIGIKTFTNLELKPLTQYLQNKYVVLTGQTGAGKSSLINKLDPTKHLEVGEISLALGRGKHTTRHTEFFDIANIHIADTPGFSSLDLTKYSKEDLKNAFLEFANFSCLYRDCNHLKEDNCAIKEAVANGKILKSRYDNYCSFMR